MPQVLTTKAVITCPHGGTGTTRPNSRFWTIEGGIALLEGDEGKLACPNVLCPCGGYLLRSMQLNSTRVEGRRVILVTDFNQTFTGLPLTMIETHTMIDNSTPVAIPPGQEAPPLSPAMMDMLPPRVEATSSEGAYSLSAPAPVPPVTFQLGSTNPMQWLLTLIREPEGRHTDLTNGDPPGIVVTPRGGDWDESRPSLTVVMSFTSAFLSACLAGDYCFYMTGVSQRGLSAYAEFVLTVSA